MKVASLVCSLVLSAACLSGQTTGASDRAVPAASSPSTAARTPSPPTAGDRLREYAFSFVNPVSLVAAGASAGLGQWRDRPKEWKEGSEAFGKRYGSAYAQHVVSSTLLLGTASLFGEDNRYFPSTGSGFSRVSDALESTVLARRYDSAGRPHRTLSFSRILALAGAAAISRLWQPESTRTVRSGLLSFGVSFGANAGVNVTREVVPGFPK